MGVIMTNSHGYLNDETFQFIVATENVRELYEDILGMVEMTAIIDPNIGPKELGQAIILRTLLSCREGNIDIPQLDNRWHLIDKSEIGNRWKEDISE